MYPRFVCLLAVVPLGTLVGATTYSIQDMYAGATLLSEWSFFTGPDPTNGYVNYVGQQDAESQGLAYVDSSGRAVLGVDSQNWLAPGVNRNSTRITSNKSYTGGVFILDAAAMPAGCSVWPAFWTNGPNWPMTGEIDIVEGVNDQMHNQMTLHSGTSNPCTTDTSKAFTGQVLGTHCYSTASADAGCGISDSHSDSFGSAFNNAGGGVYAFEWDSSYGMSMWFWTRADVPSSVNSGATTATPSSWGEPAAFWSVSTCDITDNFYDHSMIIDTTLCGGWANSAYSSSGCPGTCSGMVPDPSNYVGSFLSLLTGITMHALFVCLLAAVPFGTLVGAHRTQSRSRHRNIARQSTNKTYALEDFYRAEDFFTEWTFFTGADPTNGNVDYQSMQNATAKGLAYVDDCDNSTVLAVDSTSTVPAGGQRNSVRITSNKNYTGGLFILDAAAMPVGCGTWPSFWTNGPNWPMAGEIDVVEGVNNQTNNQMTLHSGTSETCTIDTANEAAFTGHALGTNCYSTATADAGCGISDTNSTSFGYGFNNAGGGVFALLWDPSTGISIYHFERASIPADIINQKPTPESWGLPKGFWSPATCNISANFYQHSMIIDTTICGGWAGSAYSSSGCVGTCTDMVANATNFVNAKWVINYVAVYQ
ncbi:concanavalin A-like lectin/glucanase domain-containing protein [Butyriboletus roseoflavus]|nr:concanavalin A-like lectin/glucanase domain-containing protein [Butyriboletus roseoflavus]